MTFKEFIGLVKGNIALLIALPLVLATAFGAYAAISSSEVYTARATLYLQPVQQSAADDLGADVDLSEGLVDDAVILLQSNRAVQAAAKSIGDERVDSCSVSVSQLGDSRVIEIVVSGDDADLVEDATNALANSGVEIVHDFIGKDFLKLVDSADAPESSGGASVPLYVGIGFAGGLLLGLMIMFVSHYFKAYFRDCDDAQSVA